MLHVSSSSFVMSSSFGGGGGGDEDFNYDAEYKNKCTGLGALLGAIRNQEEGEIWDDEDDGEDNEQRDEPVVVAPKPKRRRMSRDSQERGAGAFYLCRHQW